MKTKLRGRWIVILGLVIVLCGAFGGSAQNKQQQAVPPSTNPTQHAIYPGDGQSNQQQMDDQLACYRWAVQQTGGWDPYQAHDKLVQQGYAAAQGAEQAQGGAVRGAAGGALVGVAIGAITGHAGEGAAIGATAGGLTGGLRSRRAREEAQSAAQQAVNQFNQQLQLWDRNYVACMKGRHYTVN